MDWRTLLDPAGPLPRSVYWLRRGALALVAIFVVALVAVLATRGGGSGKQAGLTTSATTAAGTRSSVTTSATTAPPTSTSASATASASASAGDACPASALSVVLTTSAKSYGATGSVRFTATLHSSTACTPVGPLAIVVRSGSDRVWGSNDCAAADANVRTALSDGSAAASRTWTRQRSRPGCATVIGTTTAQPGQYVAVATWAGASSAEATFVLG